MATKDSSFPFYGKPLFINNSNKQYKDLNLLNHVSYQKSSTEASSKSFSVDKNSGYKSSEYCSTRSKCGSSMFKKDEKNGFTYYPFTKKDTVKTKGLNDDNGSTLSIHITSYENSVEASKSKMNVDSASSNAKTGLTRKWKNVREFFESAMEIQNVYEFPRQQENILQSVEVAEFRASQRLANVNGPTTSWIADTAISRKGALLLFHRRFSAGSDAPIRYLAFTLDTRHITAAVDAENDEKYVVCRTCETVKKHAKIWKIRNICQFTSDPQINHFRQCQGISEHQRFQEERQNRFYHKLKTTGISCTDEQNLYEQYVDEMGRYMEELNTTQAAKLKSRLWQTFLKAPNSSIAEQRANSSPSDRNSIENEDAVADSISENGMAENENESDNMHEDIPDHDDIYRSPSPAPSVQAPAMPEIPAEYLTEDGLLIAPTPTPSRSVSPIVPVLFPPFDPEDWNHPNNPMF